MRTLGLLPRWLSAAALAGGACADAASVDNPAPPMPPGPSSAADAGSAQNFDAGRKASVDSGPNCSIEGWCLVPTGITDDLVRVWGDGQGTLWATTSAGTIVRGRSDAAPSADGGADWAVAFRRDDVGLVSGLWGSGPTDLWAASPQGLFHGTGPTPSELTWELELSGRVNDVWGTGSNDVWAIGTFSTNYNASTCLVAHYTADRDGGAGWTKVNPRIAGEYKRLWGTSPFDVWIGGTYSQSNPSGSYFDKGLLIHGEGTGGSLTWTQWDEALPAFGDVTAGTSAGVGAAFVVGNPSHGEYTFNAPLKNYAFVSSGGWDAGLLPPSGEDALTLYATWGTSQEDLLVAGEFGLLRTYSDAGWRTVRYAGIEPFAGTFRAFWGTPGDLWLVGERGTVFHRTHAEGQGHP